MQSTASAIAAAAIGGADLSARANSAKGSDAAAAASGSSAKSAGFDGAEAEKWLSARWKVVESSVGDPTLTTGDRAEVHKSAPGAGGGAWGANKRTTNAQFTAELTKAAAAAGIR